MKTSTGVLAVSLMSGLLFTAAVQAQSSLLPQLQTDRQRMGGGEMTQLQTDSQRSASRATSQTSAGAYGGMGMMSGASEGMPAGGGYPGASGEGGYGDNPYGGYGDGVGGQGVGTELGTSAAVDAVNAAAGLANRAILRGNGNPLYVDGSGRIRNDRPHAADEGGTDDMPVPGRP